MASKTSILNKRNVLYFLFTAFLLVVFFRWGLLLHQKNENAHQDKMALYDLIIDIDTSETTLELYNQEVTRLEEQYKRQRIRIATEGIIFFVLLLLGIIRMFIYFKKEIDLALQQSNFLLSITHELKSPLSSALLNIQTLLKRDSLPDNQKQKLLQNSDEELVRLRSLVERLLLAAKMEGKEIVYDKIELNISELFGRLFQNYVDIYKDQFQMIAHIEPDLYIFGDKVLVNSVFANLLDNAVKYCSSNGKISLKMFSEDSNSIITLENEGPYISNSEKLKIWDKFYRIGDEHTRSSKGTGLGLYIVKEIVEQHNGKVLVLDGERGVVFKLELPSID